MIGHRGGIGNQGGITTYDQPNNELVLVPSTQQPYFEEQLKDAFRANNCTRCALNLVTCGAGNDSQPEVGADIRKQTAEKFWVRGCGTWRNLQNPADPILDPCYTRPWPYTCELPRGGWERGGKCLRWSVVSYDGEPRFCEEYEPIPASAHR